MKKRVKEESKADLDRKVHRTFQFAALLLLGYVFYDLYAGGFSATPSPEQMKNDIHYMTDEQVNAKVKASMDKYISSPEFKDVKDFVTFTKTNINKEQAKILNLNDGFLVYIPKNMMNDDKKQIDIENDDIKLNISSEKKPKTVSEKH